MFVGRQNALKELQKFLLIDKVPVVLHGLGGIGKTRLVVEYAWFFQAHLLAILFVRADSSAMLQAGIAGLANSSVLNLPGLEEKKQDVRKDSVLRWLQDNSNWLLIIDNVDTNEFSQEVERLLPQLTNGCVLITSRLNQWSKQVQLKQVDILSQKDAVDFLLARTVTRRQEPLTDGESAASLVQELG